MPLFRIFVGVLTGLFAVATLLPRIRHEAWWIRVFDFPRLQVSAVGAVAAALFPLAFGVRRRALGAWAGLVGALAYQARRIFPYTPLAKKQVQPVRVGAEIDGGRLSLLIANVLMENRNAQGLLDLIARYDPDLVLAVETDDWWTEHLRPLEAHYPAALKHPLGNTYGMLLFSRRELIGPEVRFLLRDDIPSIHTRVRLANGHAVELRCVHPEPPYPAWATETTERDAELLLVGKEVRELDRPVIVCGDLNDVAWSYTTRLFQKISRLLDPRIGRGMYNTFSAFNPLLRWPLDHVFISDHFELLRLERLPAWGSDHFPVFIEVSLAAGARQEQEAPTADADDEAVAEEKIEKAKE